MLKSYSSIPKISLIIFILALSMGNFTKISPIIVSEKISPNSISYDPSPITPNAQPWGKDVVVPEGMYQDGVDALDAVYDGSNFHVIYSVDKGGVEFVYYTNYIGSIWSSPIVIFDGSQGDKYGFTYSTIESIALEYDPVKFTFFVAVNAYSSIGHNRILFSETNLTLSKLTSSNFTGTGIADAFHRAEHIRLAQNGDTTIIAYQVFISTVGLRPYSATRNTTLSPSWGSPKLITNADLPYSDHYFNDITYSPSQSTFISIVRNSSAPVAEQDLIYESTDGLTWVANTTLGHLPINHDGFSMASLNEYNNELYVTYSMRQDRISSKQFTDLVITKTANGKFLPYLELIDSRGRITSYQTSTTMFVNGNIIVISIVRPDFVSTCNCEVNIAKMFTSSNGVSIDVPSLPTLTSPPDQTIRNNQTVELSWTVSSGGYGYYELYKDNVKIQLDPYNAQINWGGWFDGKIINYTDFTRLSAGIYNFTIYMYDTGGNFYNDTVWITSTIAPLSIGPNNAQDKTIFVGEDIPNLFWYVYGGLPGNFQIYKNNTLIQQGTFVYDQIKYNYYVPLTDSPISIAAIYNYTIYVDDSSGSIKTDTLWITVKNHSQLTVSSPLDQTYESTEIFTISWDVTGEVVPTYWGKNFYVSANGTWTHSPSAGTWEDGDIITITDSQVAAGTYNYTMELRNTTHVVYDSVIITIIDPPIVETLQPIISTLPNVQIFSNIVMNVTWEVNSTINGNYTIYKNGTFLIDGTWQGNDTITFSEGPLTAGIYNYTIHIVDTVGNNVYYTFIVTVIDPPISETISSAIPITTTTSITTTNTNIITTNSTSGSSDDGFLSGITLQFFFASTMLILLVRRKKQ